jgi:hypothetical protein
MADMCEGGSHYYILDESSPACICKYRLVKGEVGAMSRSRISTSDNEHYVVQRRFNFLGNMLWISYKAFSSLSDAEEYLQKKQCSRLQRRKSDRS